MIEPVDCSGLILMPGGFLVQSLLEPWQSIESEWRTLRGSCILSSNRLVYIAGDINLSDEEFWLASMFWNQQPPAHVLNISKPSFFRVQKVSVTLSNPPCFMQKCWKLCFEIWNNSETEQQTDWEFHLQVHTLLEDKEKKRQLEQERAKMIRDVWSGEIEDALFNEKE